MAAGGSAFTFPAMRIIRHTLSNKIQFFPCSRRILICVLELTGQKNTLRPSGFLPDFCQMCKWIFPNTLTLLHLLPWHSLLVMTSQLCDSQNIHQIAEQVRRSGVDINLYTSVTVLDVITEMKYVITKIWLLNTLFPNISAPNSLKNLK